MTDREGDSRRRPSLSLPILRTSREQDAAGTLTVGSLLAALGEMSFGWAIVIFPLLTLLPLPPGSSLITALPLLLVTGQMMIGYPYLRLPGPLARKRLDRQKLRRTVLKLRPVTRRLERILRPRFTAIFSSRNERPLGVMLFIIAFTLFLPVPFSGWFPAISLFITGVGLVERDGLVTTLGLASGALSVILTVVLVLSFSAGFGAIID